MKKIEAIIRPEMLPMVRKALDDVGYPGLTISEVRGHGAQKGIRQHFRGTEFVVDLIHKTKIELVVPDDSVEKLVKAICDAATTGAIGDGKIFISTIDEAIKIRTRETGNIAL